MSCQAVQNYYNSCRGEHKGGGNGIASFEFCDVMPISIYPGYFIHAIYSNYQSMHSDKPCKNITHIQTCTLVVFFFMCPGRKNNALTTM